MCQLCGYSVQEIWIIALYNDANCCKYIFNGDVQACVETLKLKPDLFYRLALEYRLESTLSGKELGLNLPLTRTGHDGLLNCSGKQFHINNLLFHLIL